MVGKNLSTSDDLKLLILHVAGPGEPEKIKLN